MQVFILDSYVSLWLLHAVGAQNKPLYGIAVFVSLMETSAPATFYCHWPHLISFMFLLTRLIKVMVSLLLILFEDLRWLRKSEGSFHRSELGLWWACWISYKHRLLILYLSFYSLHTYQRDT